MFKDSVSCKIHLFKYSSFLWMDLSLLFLLKSWTSIALVGQRSIKEAEVSQLPRSIELSCRGAFCCVQHVDFLHVCNIVPRLKTPSCNSCMQAIALPLLLLLILSSSAWQNHWINALWYCVLFFWNNKEHILCNLKP